MTSPVGVAPVPADEAVAIVLGVVDVAADMPGVVDVEVAPAPALLPFVVVVAPDVVPAVPLAGVTPVAG